MPLFLPFIDINNNVNAKLIMLVLHTLELLFNKEQIINSREFYYYFEKLGGVDLLEGI